MLEGKSIVHLLRLHKKKPVYRYVRTKKQFVEALKDFGQSKYRYLHISAHGDKDGMCTTNQDEISNVELAKMLKPYLKNKRLFLSTCSMVNEKMAKEMILRTECISVVGPRKSIYFPDAVLYWQLLYHLMFDENDKGMSKLQLKNTLQKIQSLLPIKMSFFCISDKNKKGYTGDLLKPKK